MKSGGEYDDDDIQSALESTWKPRIERETKEAVVRLRRDQQNRIHRMNAAVGERLHGHIERHPKDKKHIKEVSRVFFRGMPEEVRTRGIIEGWLNVPEMFALVRMRDGFKASVTQAFEVGKKHKATVDEIGTPGSPGAGGAAPRRSTGTETDPDAAFKERLVSGDGLVPLSSVFGPVK
jgi:hypothetical protein